MIYDPNKINLHSPHPHTGASLFQPIWGLHFSSWTFSPTLGYNVWFKLKPLFPHYKENKICGKQTFVTWLRFNSEAFISLQSLAWKEVDLVDSQAAKRVGSERGTLPMVQA